MPTRDGYMPFTRKQRQATVSTGQSVTRPAIVKPAFLYKHAFADDPPAPGSDRSEKPVEPLPVTRGAERSGSSFAGEAWLRLRQNAASVDWDKASSDHHGGHTASSSID
jgi:hypothetical protein